MTGLCLVFFTAASCDEAQDRCGQKDDLMSSQLNPRHQHLERKLKPIQYNVSAACFGSGQVKNLLLLHSASEPNFSCDAAAVTLFVLHPLHLELTK